MVLSFDEGSLGHSQLCSIKEMDLQQMEDGYIKDVDPGEDQPTGTAKMDIFAIHMAWYGRSLQEDIGAFGDSITTASFRIQVDFASEVNYLLAEVEKEKDEVENTEVSNNDLEEDIEAGTHEDTIDRSGHKNLGLLEPSSTCPQVESPDPSQWDGPSWAEVRGAQQVPKEVQLTVVRDLTIPDIDEDCNDIDLLPGMDLKQLPPVMQGRVNGWNKNNAVPQKHVVDSGAESRYSSNEDKDLSYAAVDNSVLEDIVRDVAITLWSILGGQGGGVHFTW